MFGKLKLRARLILLGRRFSVFMHIIFYFLTRLFCLLLTIASALSLFLLISQQGEHEWESRGRFFLVCGLLIIFCLISLCFFSLLGLRRAQYFEKLIKGNSFEKEDFSFKNELKNCIKSLFASLLVLALRLLWLIFFCLPALSLLLFLYYKLSHGGLAENVLQSLGAGLVCLFLFAFLFYFCTIQRYLLVVRIVGLRGLRIRDAIKQSTRLTDGYSAAVAIFKLGLALWYLLCPLIVPLFYIVPYSRLSFELLCLKYMSGELELAEKEADINLFSTRKIPQI